MTSVIEPATNGTSAKRPMLKDLLSDTMLNAAARLGVPIVLSIGLSIFLVLRVDSALAAVARTGIESQQLIKQAGATMGVFAEHNLENQRVLRNLALQTCLNVAKTETQNDACLRAAEK
jgi:hypothetical protein